MTSFALVAITGNIYAGLWYSVVFTGISVVVSVLFLKETAGRRLEEGREVERDPGEAPAEQVRQPAAVVVAQADEGQAAPPRPLGDPGLRRAAPIRRADIARCGSPGPSARRAGSSDRRGRAQFWPGLSRPEPGSARCPGPCRHRRSPRRNAGRQSHAGLRPGSRPTRRKPGPRTRWRRHRGNPQR